MQICCWLHVLFVFIFNIYLFTSSKWCQEQQRKSPPVFIYLCKLAVDYMCSSFSYSISFCLFIQSDVNKSSANHHLFLFTYANWLLITCAFHFHIQYLFVYLFKVMSTKAAQATTCFYLLMQITCWLHVFFILIFIIYLFIYSKWCKQKNLQATTCF